MHKGAAQPSPGAFGTLTVDGLAVTGDDYRAVLAPTPAGVSACTWVASSATFGLARGCAALTIVKAKTSTTKPATGSTGDTVQPLAGYPAKPVHPWNPVGTTGVVRGWGRNADIVAERDVEVVMIPGELFAREWMRTYTPEELRRALTRGTG